MRKYSTHITGLHLRSKDGIFRLTMMIQTIYDVLMLVAESGAPLKCLTSLPSMHQEKIKGF